MHDTPNKFQALTLGDLSDILDELDDDLTVEGMGIPHSFRGYYEELAFGHVDDWGIADYTPFDPKEVHYPETVRDLNQLVKASLGESFKGYKGGWFKMNEGTPLWLSNWGTSKGALKLMYFVRQEQDDNLDQAPYLYPVGMKK